MLGPFENIPFSQFHCSPLLTCRKVAGRPIAILNLPYTQGLSVHDFVDWAKFDGAEFALSILPIHKIIAKVSSIEDEVGLSKDNIGRTFRNGPRQCIFVLNGREFAFWRSQWCSSGSTVKWVSDAQQHNYVHYGFQIRNSPSVASFR